MNTMMQRLEHIWQTFTIGKRILLGITVVLSIAIFLSLLFWLNREQYQILYSNVSLEEANTITTYLSENKIPYKLSNNDKDILVPKSMMSKVRLQIAGSPNMVGGGKGFEIFDDIQVGQTDYIQKINYQRALQNELARSILAFPAVEKVRVHLVLPKQSLFVEEEAKPSASVVLTLNSKIAMTEKETQTIVNLLSMSVEGLNPSNISIVDTTGRTLFSPSNGDSFQGMTTTQLDYKMNFQGTVEKKIEELLTPMVGFKKAIAKVSAELDFSQRTIRRENYDPDKTAIRSEQIVDNTERGSSNLAAGNPNVNFRADENTGASTQESNRSSKTINYEVSKEEQNIITSTGAVERLSIAVIVDGTYVEDEKTKAKNFIPRSKEELDMIRSLVASAVGFDSSRGDTLEVSSAPFIADILSDGAGSEAGALQFFSDQLGNLGLILLNGVLVFLFLLLVVRPLVIAFITPKDEHAGYLDTLEPLLVGGGTDDFLTELEPIQGLRNMEDLKLNTQELADNNIELVVNIFRGWLNDGNTADKKRTT